MFVVYLICNFFVLVGGKFVCFMYDEVIMLFYEFGYGLYYMFMCVDEFGVLGINGVEWDVVELLL